MYNGTIREIEIQHKRNNILTPSNAMSIRVSTKETVITCSKPAFLNINYTSVQDLEMTNNNISCIWCTKWAFKWPAVICAVTF